MRAKHASVLLAALLVAGCSSATDADSRPRRSATPTTRVSTGQPAAASRPGKTIPNGTYSTEVLRADEIKRGFPATLVDQLVGPDGTKIELKLRDDHWLQFAEDSSGALELGDGGSARYDHQGRLALTSNSTGCSGCVTTYRWSFDGHFLTLTLVTLTGDPTNDDRDERIVTEHRYRKVA
jgi:hypothetical protein